MSSTHPTVPFIDLKRTVRVIRDEVRSNWESTLENCEFIGGPAAPELEQKLKNTLRVSEVVLCANGTDALIIALQAAGVKRGMKVAVPNLTFWATYEAVAQLGATPVLIDSSPDDLQMDIDEVKSAHSKFKLDAVLIAHLFGWASSRLGELRRFCEEESISLVEDGAQCFGVETPEGPVLAAAKIGTLSFYPAKVFGGSSDGGAIVSSSAELAKLSRILCNHGRSTHYSYSHVGWNSRIAGTNVRFLNALHQHIPQILSDRAGMESFYREYFSAPKFKDLVRPFGPPRGQKGNGYLSVLQLQKHSGEEITEKLKTCGIGSGRVYPETMDMQAICRDDLRVSELRHSREFCRSVINLPLFWGITLDEARISAEALESVLR